MCALAPCFPTQATASSVDISDTYNGISSVDAKDSSKIPGSITLGGTVPQYGSADSPRVMIRELEVRLMAQEHRYDADESDDRIFMPGGINVSSPTRTSQSTK
jgi:hypothetical protein